MQDECTKENPCQMCRASGVKPVVPAAQLDMSTTKQVELAAFAAKLYTENTALLKKVQQQREVLVMNENRLFNQEVSMKKQAAVVEDQAKQIERLVKRNAELNDACKSASRYFATMPAPVYLTGPSSPEFDSCLEFCRTVMAAKDKLMMTRTLRP